MESKLRGPLNGAGMYTVSSQGGDLLQDFFFASVEEEPGSTCCFAIHERVRFKC